jgi:hypothetical protein
MSNVRNLLDSARSALDARKRREELRQRQEETAQARMVYDLPATPERRKELNAALAVPHGTPWLAAVVDIARQLRTIQLDTIGNRPGTPEALAAEYRYGELVRFESVLLGAVDKALEGVKA